MQVYVSRQISLPAEDLWRHLSDFSGVVRFHPFVETADQLSASNEGVGARRKCGRAGNRVGTGPAFESRVE